ncbi:MAG: DUF421 domain-containing protein [Clostridia bacterium]|nr:DUF421 domain-containing protein [Clostridia bacterium]
MGKRQIGELQPSELVVAIMISDLATVPMSESAIPLLYGIVPIFTLVFSETLLSYLCMKSSKVRLAVTGRPTYIIRNGVIDQKEMRKARYSISDLMEELRMLDIFDISKVSCALLETNGKISVVTKENESERGYVLVCDGQIQHVVLENSPFSLKDVDRFVGKKKLKDVFLLSVNSQKEVYCVMKEV